MSLGRIIKLAGVAALLFSAGGHYGIGVQAALKKKREEEH